MVREEALHLLAHWAFGIHKASDKYFANATYGVSSFSGGDSL